MTAGEAADPQATIPRAVNNLIWRILFFYVGALLFIMMFVAWTSVGLTASPFVVAFQDVCIPAAPENVPRTTTAATSLTADANVPRGTFTAARCRRASDPQSRHVASTHRSARPAPTHQNLKRHRDGPDNT